MRYGMIIDLKRCMGCNACTVICKQKNATPPGVFWTRVYASEEGVYPHARKKLTPALCMHCKNAPCVKACPTGASYKREDGIVLVDQNKCIGCRYCMIACPYDARYFDFGDKKSYFPEMGLVAYEEATSEGKKAGTISKCILCSDRVDAGEETACAQVCPTKSRIFGNLDSPEMQAIITKRDGYQERPETDADPSVYYLPR